MYTGAKNAVPLPLRFALQGAWTQHAGSNVFNMRKLAIRLSEQGENIPGVLESLRQTFPNTKLPGKRAIQKWIQNKEQSVAHAESGDAQMRKRTSPAAQRDAILHEQLKDYEAVGGII